MGRVARGAKSRWTSAARWAIALTGVLIALALPASALADSSAQGQYKIPDVSASGGQKGGPSTPAVPAASSSGGSGNAAVPILIGGAVVIGGAGAFILYRRRRSHPSSPE
jgi:LPXTG-motif cell wall-anchored protein